jgi:uncharacterized protein YneF (UPF0154 family)
MIPEIGVMVGAYIVTRMLQIVLNHEPKQSVVVVVFAVVTVLVTVLAIGDFVLRGTTDVSLPELAR